MRKLKYIFLVSASFIFLVGCLKSGTPITGPAGATSTTAGAPGGDFLAARTQLVLGGVSAPFIGAGPVYTTDWVFSNYNPNLTYMLSAYVTRANDANPTWFKLPYVNIYSTGDALYATLKYDTVEICYYNSGGTWPDSTLNCNIIVIPQQQ
jgi:hypothetical protein